jgi:putative Ca2+/H+ antiporter (TMEM165/GDT1 family)
MNTVKIVAAISFLVFGLWTLRGDKIDDDDEKSSKFGPIITVAIAFFLAEMGDKTQLMTIAIAAQSSQPLFILTGTTIGMLIADSIGIIGGAWMCRHIPEKYIKWSAGIIFMLFGTITIYNAAPHGFVNPISIILYFLVLAVLIYIAGVKFAYGNEACNIALKKDNLVKENDK